MTGEFPITTTQPVRKRDQRHSEFLALVKDRSGPPVRMSAAPGTEQVRATLSISEAAWELGVCTETAYRQAKSGQLPGAFKFGRRWIVSREAFQRWLETR
jgi:excisionase family DNA binding protein